MLRSKAVIFAKSCLSHGKHLMISTLVNQPLFVIIGRGGENLLKKGQKADTWSGSLVQKDSQPEAAVHERRH